MTILHELINHITDGEATIRKRSAYILGTVDEVAALEVLYQAYSTEVDPDTKQAIQWAGKRLKAIQATGYSTLDALIAHYRLLGSADPSSASAEQQVIDDYKLRAHMNTMNSEKRSAVGKTALSMALLPPIFSAGRFLGGGFTGAEISSKLDALDGSTSDPLIRSFTPPRPTQESIASVIQRLRAATEPQRRLDLVLDLAQIYNNPEALPHLAALFVRDEDERVRETAQRTAKLIYWNSLYWNMRDDGSLEQEMARRAEVRPSGASQPPASQSQPTSNHEPQQDIVEILRKAEEARERRRRGK
jgi:hypothetical protein